MRRAYQALSVATATSVFFRSIGGSVGVAVLGVVLNAQLLGLLSRLHSKYLEESSR